MEVHPEDYKRYFGGVDGPGPTYSEVVPEEALFLPQGGADAGAEEVRRDRFQNLIETPCVCLIGVDQTKLLRIVSLQHSGIFLSDQR